MLPVDYSEAPATGAADAVAITVSGIKTGDELLAVIAWSPGSDPAPVAVSDFTVGDGTITAGTLTTDGKSLWVMWHESRD
jgi:hypothetical protein